MNKTIKLKDVVTGQRFQQVGNIVMWEATNEYSGATSTYRMCIRCKDKKKAWLSVHQTVTPEEHSQVSVEPSTNPKMGENSNAQPPGYGEMAPWGAYIEGIDPYRKEEEGVSEVYIFKKDTEEQVEPKPVGAQEQYWYKRYMREKHEGQQELTKESIIAEGWEWSEKRKHYTIGEEGRYRLTWWDIVQKWHITDYGDTVYTGAIPTVQALKSLMIWLEITEQLKQE